ncbi:MAG: DUF4372 domain-containing protein [Odoribacteraceae bacterium]|jgi:hypothetical protein|nr:DUF4372 domain-containing protein [Odoribacteraceae bacterium]
MGKDSEKHLVGPPIFKQMIKMLPKEEFALLVNRFGSDKNYRSFYSWDELVTMLLAYFPGAIRWAKSVIQCVPWAAG